MNTCERRVVGALWSLQGVGPKSIENIERRFPLSELLTVPARTWAPLVDLPPSAREALAGIETLEPSAEALERNARRFGQQVLFPGDSAWPSRLDDIEGAPRVLFMVGLGNAATPRHRVALVGTRHAEPGTDDRVRAFARELAEAGLGIVSGAAEGIDRAAHFGALDGGGETWAFLGSAIEQMDSGQRLLVKPFSEGCGTFYSQYPPGSRADQSTFSRRNRLISGASDVVLVARAPKTSGALHTAKAAIEQRRPLLVIPSDPWVGAAKGSNRLLREHARVCLEAEDVLAALGLGPTHSGPPARPGPMGPVSPTAALILAVLERFPCDVDELQSRLALPAVTVATALIELELEGYVRQKGGGRWEKP